MKSETKDVAVLMSVYIGDTLSSVERALNSIVNQTYQNIIIYIYIDGPVLVDVEKYLNFISSAEENIYVYRRSENKGLACSLNELLLIVLSKDEIKYIARMDADDYSSNDRILIQYNFMQENKFIDVVGSYIYELYKGNKTLVTYPLTHDNMRFSMGKRNPLAHPSVFFRITFFNKAGLYPISSLRDEDTLLWLNGFLSGAKFANINIPLHTMNIDEDFYKRRRGLKKSYLDLRNRWVIINKLKLSSRNYLFSIARFILFAFMPSKILKIAYNKIRK